MEEKRKKFTKQTTGSFNTITKRKMSSVFTETLAGRSERARGAEAGPERTPRARGAGTRG